MMKTNQSFATKLDEIYQNILNELAKGHRALVRLNGAELQDLNEFFAQNLSSPAVLKKILCVVEHSASLYTPFEKNILTLLKAEQEDSVVIFALNCARKHIVEGRFQKGQRLDFEFLEAIKELLFHKNPEVVEWTLRLIESCGNQGVYFLKNFDKIKPPPWKWFNQHQRAVREIITLLERRWSPGEKS